MASGVEVTVDNVPVDKVPIERNRGFTDRDGVEAFPANSADVDIYQIDWTNKLVVGETISTSSWVAQGPSISSDSFTGAVVYVFASGSGDLINTIVTDGGRTFNRRIRIVATDKRSSTDYGA